MRRYQLQDLQYQQDGHILKGILPGQYISTGGLSFSKPGARSHTSDGPNGRDYHVHGDCEAFIILQGKGLIEINGQCETIGSGDVLIVEPGEDHHVISSVEDPIVTVWFHASAERHSNQR